jgi:hypothetical protein
MMPDGRDRASRTARSVAAPSRPAREPLAIVAPPMRLPSARTAALAAGLSFALTVPAFAQRVQGAAERPDPVALVTEAERLLRGKELEDAILVLWRALGELAERDSNPVNDATRMSARFLLQEKDPREAERRRVFTSIAKQQVELAGAYRAKKWLDVAATRLEIADRYDAEAGGKERAALEAARPKPKPGGAAAGGAPAAPPKQSTLAPLLQRANASRVFGEWREVGECLESQGLTGKEDFALEWLATQPHADHEIVVEWQAAEPTKAHNGGFWIGCGEQRDGVIGYRAVFRFDPRTQVYEVWLSAYPRKDDKDLASVATASTPDASGFHRFAVQVRGNRLRAQLNGSTPVEAEVAAPIRGCPGLLGGITGSPSCAMRYRNFRIDPLPADRPSDDELRQQADSRRQNEITAAVETAKDLVTKKQHEAASLQLREAVLQVEQMPAGVLRDNLAKTIDAQLATVDNLAPRRKKTAQAIAVELLALADQYAAAGMARAALHMTLEASSFDPVAGAPRVEAAREAVNQWNLAQATVRAGELAPPADDGAVLREWFEKGRRLDTRSPAWIVAGPSARVEGLPAESYSGWMPPPLAKEVTKASVHVHLPSAGAEAGLCFDVVHANDFAVAFVGRRKGKLELGVFRHLAGKWTQLGRRDVPIDAWRLDAWHQLTLEANAAGVVAKVGATEIKVARQLPLGTANGKIALWASNATKEPLAVEVRAFRVSP